MLIWYTDCLFGCKCIEKKRKRYRQWENAKLLI